MFGPLWPKPNGDWKDRDERFSPRALLENLLQYCCVCRQWNVESENPRCFVFVFILRDSPQQTTQRLRVAPKCFAVFGSHSYHAIEKRFFSLVGCVIVPPLLLAWKTGNTTLLHSFRISQTLAEPQNRVYLCFTLQ